MYVSWGLFQLLGNWYAISCTFNRLQDENMIFLNDYDEAILHLILAGSDIILCQSFDDPVLQLPVSE